MDTMDRYNPKDDWSEVNEQARAFAEAFLKKVGRGDLAEYFGADRKVGVSIDWRLFFSGFSREDDSAVGLEVCLLAKKDKPNEPRNVSDGKQKKPANGFLSRIFSARCR